MVLQHVIPSNLIQRVKINNDKNQVNLKFLNKIVDLVLIEFIYCEYETTKHKPNLHP